MFGLRQIDSKTKIKRARILTPFTPTPNVTDESVEAIMTWPKFLRNRKPIEGVSPACSSAIFTESPVMPPPISDPHKPALLMPAQSHSRS